MGELIAPRLPLLHRIRSTLVCDEWRELLKTSHFWANIDFEGGRADMIDDELLVALCRRALVEEEGLRTTLTSIDVTADACRRITMRHQGQSLLTVLAGILDSSGRSLTCVLKSISVGDKIVISTVEQATQLITDCPLLTHVGLTIKSRGAWPETLAALSEFKSVLVNGRTVKRVVDRVILRPVWEAPNQKGIVAFADALAQALAACSVRTLEFDDMSEGSWADAHEHSHAADPVAAAAAAAQLGALLADAAHGPHAVVFAKVRGGGGGWGPTPTPSTPHFIANMLLQLSPESPLRTLVVPDGDGDEGPLAVTDALFQALLGPLKLRLESVDVGGRVRCVCTPRRLRLRH